MHQKVEPNGCQASESLNEGERVNDEDRKVVTSSIPIGASREQLRRVWQEQDSEEIPPEVEDFLVERSASFSAVAEKDTLSKLQGAHVLSMIDYIDRNSPLTKTDIYTNISRSSGTAKKLEDLESMGLIKIFTTGRTNLNVIVITKKGKRVAEYIRMIVDAIEYWDESYDGYQDH